MPLYGHLFLVLCQLIKTDIISSSYAKGIEIMISTIDRSKLFLNLSVAYPMSARSFVFQDQILVNNMEGGIKQCGNLPIRVL